MLEFTTIAQAKKVTGLTYLGTINSSSKLKKNGKVSGQYTYGLYLAPASISGHNVCSHSTPECRLGCLATSGRAGMEILAGKDKILNCRINKTKLFYSEPEFFMQWLIAEIQQANAKAIKDNMGFSVRLNCTSDIDWQMVKVNGQSIFEIFPDIQFYDYTKNSQKFFYKSENYHLTYSYTGRNWNTCTRLLDKGHNIAMVFNVKHDNDIPATFKGYNVINGDETDYRVNDGKGQIIGLKWKRIANKEAEKQVLNSCFVVDPANIMNEVKTNELVAVI